MNSLHITTSEEENNVNQNQNIEPVQEHQKSLDGYEAYMGATVKKRHEAPMQPISLTELVERIKTGGDHADVIFRIRELQAQKTGEVEPDKKISDQQDELKKKFLPYMTLGKFADGYLKNENLIENKFDIQDLDGLGEQLEDVRHRLMKDPFVFVLFISPKGNGLKVVREYDKPIRDANRYKEIHTFFGGTLEQTYGVKVDSSTHDAARACFLSHDPTIHISRNHQLLQTDTVTAQIPKGTKKKGGKDREKILSLLDGVSENRNDALVSLISVWLKMGCDDEFVLAHAMAWNQRNDPPLPEDEVRETVTKRCKAYRDPENLDLPFVTIRESLKQRRADDVSVAKQYFKWLKHNRRSQFFTDENSNHYVYTDSKLIPMNERNAEFNAFLLSSGNFTTVDKLGKIVVGVLNALCHDEGIRIKRNTWLESRINDLTVFLNLRNDQNEMLKITPGGCEVVQNGANRDSVFMLKTVEDKLKPVRFAPMEDDELRDALQLGHDLIAKHIPCSEEERWFAYGWRLAYPLYDFTTKHITLRAQGSSSAGKTTACNVLALSLYGESYEGMSTTASLYRDAAVNPLIIEDNLENKRFYTDEGHGDFYLLAATGGIKQKSAQGTDSGVAIERIRSLILCSGIESIAKPEQTNRMMIIHCDKNQYNSDFTDAVYLDIRRHRDRMLSANFVLTQKVLSRMKNGAWHDVQKRLGREYPDHAKNRMFEHIALIILFLEEHQKVCGLPKDVWILVDGWMKNQTRTAFEEITESDPIIQALDIIRESAFKQLRFDTTIHSNEDERARLRSQMIKLDVDTLLATVLYGKDSFSISGTSKLLLPSFAKAFQIHLNRPFPFSNGRILAQRIKEVAKELSHHGYTLTIDIDKHNHQGLYTFKWEPSKQIQDAAGTGGNEMNDPADNPAEIVGQKMLITSINQ